MTKQVLYCRTTGLVIEWQDTELFAYAAPSVANGVLQVTAEQWVQKELPHLVFNGELTKVEIPQPSPAHRWDGAQWSLDTADMAELQNLNAEQLCARVDAAADSARQAIAGDPLLTLEYARAATHAQAFKDEGYPKKAVPLAISAWVVKGRTARQAADEILEKAAQFNESLLTLRTIRLKAKERIKTHAAKGKMDLARDASDEAVMAIRKLVMELED
ncbi:hypothetical protein [Pseudomonas frederiksbergensis]|jgi:hypothetical protein|uniref:Phage tail protein n=1 Tax=Pseudomonas frederiksbergensis TaxID=104087 RepID=A0A423IPM0_9PSED|nr:hypothetical protein [Pseudomonas frederiksbergensis]RON27343.1 hypothetical protein BK661_26025 [Pseudomonas frederiksbergensis]